MLTKLYRKLEFFSILLAGRHYEHWKETKSSPNTLNSSTIPMSEQGKSSETAKPTTAKLIKWITAKYQKEIDARKSDKGKSTQKAKLDALLVFFSDANKENLTRMFELQKLIVLAKLKLINKLNRLQNVDTFVKTRKGYKVTGAEGYVAIDKLGGDAVKLVDRMEFSYNNFSPDILKGWDSTSRG